MIRQTHCHRRCSLPPPAALRVRSGQPASGGTEGPYDAARPEDAVDKDAIRIHQAAGGTTMKHPVAAVLWPEYAKLYLWKE